MTTKNAHARIAANVIVLFIVDTSQKVQSDIGSAFAV